MKTHSSPVRGLKLFAFCFFIILTQLTRADTEIPFTDSNFQYQGRVPFKENEGAVLSWSGSGVIFRVEGPSLELTLDDSKGQNFFNLILNGNEESTTVIDLDKGENVIPVDLSRFTGPVTITLLKRNDTFKGSTLFAGICLPDGAQLLPPPDRPERRIEFYGDSITVGMGNEAPENAKDDVEAENNNYIAYGAITARNLDAEYRCIAKSGIGIMVSWFSTTMPEFYNRANSEQKNSQWDFSQWTPHVVVINLFQNDSWLAHKRLDPAPTPDAIIAAYKSFVETIRKEYPEAHIVCALGSMDATKEGKPWPGYIESAVDKLKSEGDENISVCFFPFDGFSKHPRVRHHQRNAEILTAHIKEQMGW